jgi:CRP-like cAMP-binding protein
LARKIIISLPSTNTLSMFDVLVAYFHRAGVLMSAEEISILKNNVIPKTLKKGDFMQREGDTVKYGAFIAKGFLRSYVIDNKGREHIIQFAPENWWISDKAGISQEAKATFFIDAIEDSEMFLMDFNSHNTCMQTIPAYTTTFQSGMQKRGSAKDKRIVQALSATAEERYLDFIETYPSIVQRVPQHMLASFLGITPETLSRIRKLQSKRK